jgi:hypothetical protein
MRYAKAVPAVIALLAGTIVLNGCSGSGLSMWRLNSTENDEAARALPAIDMDFSPHRAPVRPTARTHRPASLARASSGHPWSGGADARPWRYIVIHHSATTNGNAAKFHRQHLDRGWDELGYHFVINNGRGGPDGRVEVGPRWRKQKHGAHCGGTPDNEYNEVGIGICLVGNFQNRMPTAKQMAALRNLTNYLMETYDIPPHRVIAHRDAPGASTDCCGHVLYNHLNLAFRPALTGDAYARR